jgi:hypothetical protein
LRRTQPADYAETRALTAQWVETYNPTQLHSVLEYLTPREYCRGHPKAWLAKRHAKLLAARQGRGAVWETFYGAAGSAGG